MENLPSEEDQRWINNYLKPVEDKCGVTISIINNNPGVVIKCETYEEYEKYKEWAFPAFKALKKAYSDFMDTSVTPQNDVRAASQLNNGDRYICPDCKTDMVYRNGQGPKGPWAGYFCPNGSKENKTTHQTKWL